MPSTQLGQPQTTAEGLGSGAQSSQDKLSPQQWVCPRERLKALPGRGEREAGTERQMSPRPTGRECHPSPQSAPCTPETSACSEDVVVPAMGGGRVMVPAGQLS